MFFLRESSSSTRACENRGERFKRLDFFELDGVAGLEELGTDLWAIVKR